MIHLSEIGILTPVFSRPEDINFEQRRYGIECGRIQPSRLDSFSLVGNNYL